MVPGTCGAVFALMWQLITFFMFFSQLPLRQNSESSNPQQNRITTLNQTTKKTRKVRWVEALRLLNPGRACPCALPRDILPAPGANALPDSSLSHCEESSGVQKIKINKFIFFHDAWRYSPHDAWRRSAAERYTHTYTSATSCSLQVRLHGGRCNGVCQIVKGRGAFPT